MDYKFFLCKTAMLPDYIEKEGRDEERLRTRWENGQIDS